MTKYDAQFKRAVVKDYLSGVAGSRTLAQRHGVYHGAMRRWVSLFRAHGEAGLKRSLSKTPYTADFKLNVLQQMWDEGLSCREVASLFNIRSPASVGIWQRQYYESGIHALEPRPKGRRPSVVRTPTTLPLAVPKQSGTRTRGELLEELEYLRAENAYLKNARCPAQGKGAGPASDGAKEKAQIVRELRAQHPLAFQLRAAQLARATFYYQCKVLDTGDRLAELKAKISAIYVRHKGRYGYRPITAEPQTRGQHVNHKTVQRLMQLLGLKSLVLPKRYRSFRGEVGQIAPNLLARDFRADERDRQLRSFAQKTML